MVKFVVVVKFMVKFVVKLKHCWIGTKIGVVVDIDYLIMVVVCVSSLWKIETLSYWNKTLCGSRY